MNTSPMLTVAQVLELVPGDEQNATWINPGFIAVVREIKSTKTKSTGKPMHICTLEDTTNPGIEISMTTFTPSAGFSQGDTIQVEGKGLRRSEYNGLAQVSIGRETEIHILKRAAGGSKAAAPSTAKQNAPVQPPPNSTPVEGQRPMPMGVTVGMAINNAVQILIHNAKAEGDVGAPIDLSKLRANVEAVAIDLIIASRRLETGQVAPSEDVPY